MNISTNTNLAMRFYLSMQIFLEYIEIIFYFLLENNLAPFSGRSSAKKGFKKRDYDSGGLENS